MPDFPKLLVATEFPPNIGGGGGAIVRQMLKEWPVEKLYWWSCMPDQDQTYGQRVASHAVASIPPRFYPNRLARGLKCWLLENFWTPWAARHFCQTVAAVQPDVVWVIPHLWSIPPLARALPQIKVPYHFSLHDYPDTRHAMNHFGPAYCRWWAQLVDQLYAQAATRDAVGREMADDLRARTGVPSGVNHSGLEPDDFAALAAATPAVGDAIRIAYAGTITVDAEFALFSAAIAKIRPQLPRPVSLEFFGVHSYRDRSWFDSSWMTEHGNLSRPKLAAALREHTWGFSPMALTDDDPRYNRFSLPTKFVSYLAAGLPVIAIGHPESTVIKMTAAYPVGFRSTTSAVDALAAQLLPALSEPEPGAKFRPAICQCAATEFDASKLRNTIGQDFRKAMQQKAWVKC